MDTRSRPPRREPDGSRRGPRRRRLRRAPRARRRPARRRWGGGLPLGPVRPARLRPPLDARADVQAAADPRVSGPCCVDTRAPITGTPYRVEPRDCGRISSPWDIPPEVPDPRDFERVETLDELLNAHHELREEIWAVPEDFISPFGYARYGGIAYVPFWARNTIRYGRLAIFPWVHAEAIWHSNFESRRLRRRRRVRGAVLRRRDGASTTSTPAARRSRRRSAATTTGTTPTSTTSPRTSRARRSSTASRSPTRSIVGAEIEESRVASERNFAAVRRDT